MSKRIEMLAVPLASRQIEAAWMFAAGDWGMKELLQLKQAFPKVQEAIKVKAVVVNQLYATGIIAISRVADCLESRLRAPYSTDPQLVEDLVVEIRRVHPRKEYVFVSKYCHFFIDPVLPILDQFSEYMAHRHLGRHRSKNPKRYLAFSEDIEKLKELAGLSCDCDQLDAYLWVAGAYWSRKKNPKVKINADLKAHFERLDADPEAEPTLAELLGLSLGKGSVEPVSGERWQAPQRSPQSDSILCQFAPCCCGKQE